MTATRPLQLIVDEEITLRQFMPEDADAIFTLIDGNRAHLSQYGEQTSAKYPTQESVLSSILNPPDPSKLRFGIWIAENYVGTVNLTPGKHDASAEIGYYLGKQYQSKGYAKRSVRRLVKYAFEELNLFSLYARVHKDNAASIAVLKRTGFLPIGPDLIDTMTGLHHSANMRYFHLNHLNKH